MAIPKTGSRQIVVDGIAYRWRVRPRRPRRLIKDGGGPLTFAAERIGGKGSVLVVSLPQERRIGLGGFYDYFETPATPRQVRVAIQRAIRAGWEPEKSGQQFLFELVDVSPMTVDKETIRMRR